LNQGTIVVIFGVIGIVTFGSINSGLATETHVAHLTYLWRRPNWLGYFFFMSFALTLLLIFVSSLDAVLAARSDISAVPFTGIHARRPAPPGLGYVGKLRASSDAVMLWVKEKLEAWTAAKGDQQIAWTLGIGWACCGGGLAGGCLVFAKAT
jgi:magnesium transporter